MVAIPASFAARIAGRPADPSLAAAPDGDTWLARLPRLLEEYLERWNLRPEDGAWSGSNALVVPVRRGTGEDSPGAGCGVTRPSISVNLSREHS